MPEDSVYVRLIKRRMNYDTDRDTLIAAEYSEPVLDDDGKQKKDAAGDPLFQRQRSLSLYRLDRSNFDEQLAQVLIEHTAQIVFTPEKKLEVLDVTDLTMKFQCPPTPVSTPFKFSFANSRHHDLYFRQGSEDQDLEDFVDAVMATVGQRYIIAQPPLMKDHVHGAIYDEHVPAWRTASEWTAAATMIESKASEKGKSEPVKKWRIYPALKPGIHLSGLLSAHAQAPAVPASP